MDTQTVGRLGELAVEEELVKRGWRVGNYNSTTVNQRAFDIFAAKGRRRIEIRVKSYRGNAKRTGEGIQYTTKKDGEVFGEFDPIDDGDFVVVVRVCPDEAYEFYVLPTRVVGEAIKWTNKRWHEHPKRDGTPRKMTNHRAIDFDGEQTERSPHRGFGKIWARYQDAWDLLDPAASGH